MTIFEKIAAGQISVRMIHETAELIAFHDGNPQAPVHALIVPRRVIARIGEATPGDAELLGKLLLAAPEVARLLGVAESGYRVVINNGRDAGETVPHLHVHLLGGRSLQWPPG
ncbi:MAG: HIT-like protein [Chthoniobacteraceae bacterium]|nr:HIT-like protein [Chthoniobacteraceae bacterium]